MRRSQSSPARGRPQVVRGRAGARPILLADIVRGYLQLLRLHHVYHLLYLSAVLRARRTFSQAEAARREKEPSIRRRRLRPQRERGHRRFDPLYQGAELPDRADRRVRHRRQLHRQHRRRGARGGRNRVQALQHRAGWQGLRARLRLQDYPEPVRRPGLRGVFRLRRGQRARRELLPRDEQDLRQRCEGVHELP